MYLMKYVLFDVCCECSQTNEVINLILLNVFQRKCTTPLLWKKEEYISSELESFEKCYKKKKNISEKNSRNLEIRKHRKKP